MKKDRLGTLKTFEMDGPTAELYSLAQLEAQGIATISRLPISIRISSNEYFATAKATALPKRTYSVSR